MSTKDAETFRFDKLVQFYSFYSDYKMTNSPHNRHVSFSFQNKNIQNGGENLTSMATEVAKAFGLEALVQIVHAPAI